MAVSRGFDEGRYAMHYRSVAERVAMATSAGTGRHIRIDMPGLDGLLAFPTGGLTVIVGWSGAGKTVLCDNVVWRAGVPVVYLPLQSTSLEAAHERLCAVGSGLEYWEGVVGRRGMAERIALAEASERLMDQRKVLVNFDEVMPSVLNDVLLDVIGESEENPGTIDETADECLVVLDNMDMVAADDAPLSERVRFLKDLVKGTRVALVAAVADDYDELWRDLANADEVYVMRQSPRIEPAPADFVPGPRGPERRRRTLLGNVKTSRFDGHPVEVEFDIDLPTRTICEIEG